jgi:hypothetical protein
MHIRFVQKLSVCLVFGATLTLPTGVANAAILGTETPTSFSLTLDSYDFPPIDGPSGLERDYVGTLFDGQYWNVTTFGQSRGGRVFRVRYLTASTENLNSLEKPYAQLVFQPYITIADPPIDPNPPLAQSSYLASSPFVPFTPNDTLLVKCQKGTPDCAFFDLQHGPAQVIGPSMTPVSVEITGDYQPPDEPSTGPKSVPEPSTEIGSFAALGFIAFRLFCKLRGSV